VSTVLARAVVKIEGDIEDLKAAFDLAESETEKAGKRMHDLGKKMTTFVTLPLVALGGLAVHEFSTQEDALVGLEATLRATGGAAGVTSEHIQALAASLQNTTLFADDVVDSAAQVLLTFTNVRNVVGQGNDVFDRTIKVAADLASTPLFRGDLADAVRSLGIAMESPEEGMARLRRAGIIFTDQEKDQVKALTDTGRVLEAQRLILDKVEGKVKDVAAAMANTPHGRLISAWNAVKDSLESVGAIIAPFVSKFADGLKTLAHWFDTLTPAMKTTIVIIAAMAAAVGPLLLVMSALAKALVVGRVAMLLFGAELKTAATLMTAGGILAIGLGVIAALWVQMRIEVEKTTAAMAVAMGQANAALASLTPKQAEGTLQRVTTKITSLNEELANEKRRLKEAEQAQQEHTRGLSGPAYAQAFSAHQKLIDSIGEEIEETEAAIQRHQDEAKILQGVVDASKAVSNANTGMTISHENLKKAMDALNQSLRVIPTNTRVLGSEYDAIKARADAYGQAVNDLIANGATLNTVVDAQGRTVRDLVDRWAALNKQVEDAARQQALFNTITKEAPLVQYSQRLRDVDALLKAGRISEAAAMEQRKLATTAFVSSFALASAALENAKTPAQVYNETIAELDRLMKTSAAPSQERYAEAVLLTRNAYLATLPEADQLRIETEALGLNQEGLRAALLQTENALADATAAMDTQAKMAEQLKQAMADILGDAIDQLVEFAFTGKQSFGDFVQSALLELTKLIIKLEIMKAIMKSNGFMSFGGGFASGGFLSPGEIGLVGETGPELVQGGHTGLTVAPIRASGVMGGGMAGGDSVQVNVTVAAIDSKGVTDFFEQNEGLVSNAMLRAFQKSRILRNRLGG